MTSPIAKTVAVDDTVVKRSLIKLMAQKTAIYALYQDEVGKLMDPRVVRETLTYFDEFYDELKTPKRARDLFETCVGPS